jgi:three-Cys-motif partner protein
MTAASLKFDEIGYWSKIKLDIVAEYGEKYTTTFKNASLRKYYIDAFSGAGVHVSKDTGVAVEGSPSRALRVEPPFDGFYFIDMKATKTSYLEALYGNRRDVRIHTGDANEYLVNELLPKIQFKNYNRALCLLDPYGLDLDWEVIYQAGQSGAIDMFLNFPVMDMNRNAIWRHPEEVPASGIQRMNRFWGDESWRGAAYAESPQQELWGEPDIVKQDNEAIVTAFCERLGSVAGFEFVAEPLPMRNSTNAVVYYLCFASQKPVAERILTSIFSRYRALGTAAHQN